MPENDRLTLTTWVAPRARVLYAEGNSDSAYYLRDALTREGIDVALASAADLPQQASALSDYQAVILSDVPRDALDDMRMSALESYVRDGGGLIYIGGETTYGQSGYAGTALERLLPVEFKAQEQRKDLALVVCLDRSYSMKGRSMELAKAATRAALAILEEQHQFGVIAFDSRPYETVPLQSVRSRHHAEDLIDRIQAGGQTNIYPALATALRWLEGAESPSRHVILLSDGDTAPADFERLLQRMAGSTHQRFHRCGRSCCRPRADVRYRALGEGPCLLCRRPGCGAADLRRRHAQRLSLDAGRGTRPRGREASRIEALRGIDFAGAPMLRGFARTKARDDAEVLLESASGAPLLVRWQYGLGRAVVFASDAKNRWAADWLQWDGYGKFWGQITRDVLRRDTGESLRFKVTREGGDAHIRLDAMSDDGNWRNRLAPAVRVRLPTGAEQTLALHQTSPGAYVGTVALGSPGSRPFSFGLVPGGGITREAARRTGLRRLHYSYPDEYRSGAAQCRSCCARWLKRPAGSSRPRPRRSSTLGAIVAARGKALWPWFAAAALVAVSAGYRGPARSLVPALVRPQSASIARSHAALTTRAVTE